MNEQPQATIKLKSWLCERCGSEFTDHEAYKQHKSDHQLGKIPDEPSDGDDASKEEVTVTHEETKSKDDRPWAKVEPSKPIQKEIQLTYKYLGVCTACGAEVDTIGVSVAGKYVVLAWCNKCKKEMTQREVVKL